jgi:DNA-directed RNA polymerase subunit beta
MNVGQILETLLGWAGVELTKKLKNLLKEKEISKIRQFLLDIYKPHKDEEFVEFLKNAKDSEIMAYAIELSEKGIRYACPVFEGLTLEEVKEQLKLAGLPEDGKVRLRDGRTGEYFDYPVTVGYMYLMKLIHMVEDKIHARSIGKYSLITQQPLGGRAHFGGQRFGEMEVWAAEAHGAAYALQELLTVKSDDVIGRNLLYRSIIRNNLPPEPAMPESFNVLVKKLRGLCLDVQVKTEKERKS